MSDFAFPSPAQIVVTTKDGQQKRNIELMGPFAIIDNGTRGYGIAHIATGLSLFLSQPSRTIARLIVATLIEDADWKQFKNGHGLPNDCLKRLIYVRTLIRTIPITQH